MEAAWKKWVQERKNVGREGAPAQEVQENCFLPLVQLSSDR